MMQTKAEIIEGLEAEGAAAVALLEAAPPEQFSQSPAGKWSPGTQADHLVRSAKPVNLALRLPGLLIGLRFGTADRPSGDYDAVVGKYVASLEAGGKASGPYVPPAVRAEQQAATIAALRKQYARLSAGVAPWSEAQLDRYFLPHPLIGKLTVREVLFFTHYHTRHHLDSIRALNTG